MQNCLHARQVEREDTHQCCRKTSLFGYRIRWEHHDSINACIERLLDGANESDATTAAVLSYCLRVCLFIRAYCYTHGPVNPRATLPFPLRRHVPLGTFASTIARTDAQTLACSQSCLPSPQLAIATLDKAAPEDLATKTFLSEERLAQLLARGLVGTAS